VKNKTKFQTKTQRKSQKLIRVGNQFLVKMSFA
jgi:hypothetical protein